MSAEVLREAAALMRERADLETYKNAKANVSTVRRPA
jgi:hypothetical protein